MDQVEWKTLPGLAPYTETLAAMEARVAAIHQGTAPEAIWLLEHPPQRQSKGIGILHRHQ